MTPTPSVGGQGRGSRSLAYLDRVCVRARACQIMKSGFVRVTLVNRLFDDETLGHATTKKLYLSLMS